jgi:hypothetical protein
MEVYFMKQETINLYKFDELSDEVKESVLDKHRDINLYYDWYSFEECLLELTDDDLKKIGVKEPIESLFSYGDMFFDLDRGSYLDLQKIKVRDDEVFRKLLCIPAYLWEHTYYSFEEGGRWERNTKLYLELVDLPDDDDNQELYLNQIAEHYFEEAKGIWDEMMERALKRLQESYYAAMEDESVAETLRCNEYEFLVDGSIWK